jgi:hypothetical protein
VGKAKGVCPARGASGRQARRGGANGSAAAEGGGARLGA